jgi:hypothetical protein
VRETHLFSIHPEAVRFTHHLIRLKPCPTDRTKRLVKMEGGKYNTTIPGKPP